MLLMFEIILKTSCCFRYSENFEECRLVSFVVKSSSNYTSLSSFYIDCRLHIIPSAKTLDLIPSPPMWGDWLRISF